MYLSHEFFNKILLVKIQHDTIIAMADKLRAIEWEALEHHHDTKSSDWFWVLGILTICGAVAAIIFSNILLSLVILIGGAVMAILATRPANMVNFVINQRGVKIDNSFFPYTTLETYYIEEHPIVGHQLLLRSQKIFMPLLILPLPEEDVDDIEEIIAERIPEQHLEEPFVNQLLEFFGF